MALCFISFGEQVAFKHTLPRPLPLTAHTNNVEKMPLKSSCYINCVLPWNFPISFVRSRFSSYQNIFSFASIKGSGASAGNYSGGNGGKGNNGGGRQGSGDGKHPFGQIYNGYLTCLREQPLLTKTLTTSIINTLSDIIAQIIEQHHNKKFLWNWRRTFALGFWGLIFMGPFFHSWYAILERVVPSGRWAFLKKILLDQTFAAAFFNLTFFMGTGILEGFRWTEIRERIRQKFWQTMVANWRVWPFVQCITFTLIPLQFRVLWVNMVTILWIIYFSTLAHSSHEK
eukprot:jgi/Galph1/355/GphlegSOOS_G5062.1